MKKFIKENWFVVLVAVFFLAISVWFGYDQHKNDLPSKNVSGKDVVYSIDDQDFTADELYDLLYPVYGNYLLSNTFSNTILDLTIPTTKEISEDASSYVSYYTSMYYYYGGLTYLNQLAVSYGYSDAQEYFEYLVKSREMVSKYVSTHVDEFVNEEFLEKYDPRLISYVLIKFEDPANPTSEELNRLQAAKQAWNSDEYSAENFAEFAKAYSEDSSTASNGGVLGYIDTKTTDYDDEFTKQSLSLKAGEASDWFFSENFGYFMVKCDTTDYNDMLTDTSFLSRILSENEDASNKILWYYANQAGVQFEDEAVKDYILDQLGVKEGE